MTRELFEEIVKDGNIPRIPTVSYFRANPEALDALTVEKLVEFVPMVSRRSGLIAKYKGMMKLDKKKVAENVKNIPTELKEDLDTKPATITEDLDKEDVKVKENAIDAITNDIMDTIAEKVEPIIEDIVEDIVEKKDLKTVIEAAKKSKKK